MDTKPLKINKDYDLICVGGGIMSATLALLAKILVAGQRVQTIKRNKFEGGVLEFDTEVINTKDVRITCRLGTLPGASNSVKIMLDV